MKMRPWFPSDSGSTVSPVRRARSKRSDPGCPTSEAGVSVREGCRGSDGPRDGRAAAQLHRGGRGPGTGAVTVCARRPAAVRPAARRPRRSSGTARPRADASPLGPEPSPVEGTSLRAPPQPLAPHLPTKRTRTKLASVREEPLLTMLTRNRTKGQSSSDAQNSQFRSAQGRRGGTMGVPGKVPVLQYCSWKASWGRRGGLSARPRGPGSSELRVLQAPGAVPLPHLAVPPRGDMERQGHRSSATKSWGASQPAPASSDWAGEQPEAQAQGAGTASQAVHTGQGDEGGAALSQAPAPGCRRGLSSDGPPKLNSVCARPGLTARRVCVLRLCRTFTPRPPRGGGGRHRLLRSLTALGVSPFLTGSHPENTLRGGRARQACLRPVSAYERLLLRAGESSGKQASRGLKCWVLSFNTRLKRLEYVLLLFQPGCTG